MVDLDSMTWGDLRRLVSLSAGKDGGDRVIFEFDEDNWPPYPVAIVLRGGDGA